MAPLSRKMPKTKLVVCCCQLGVWLGSREQLYSAQVAAASCQPQVVAPPLLTPPPGHHGGGGGVLPHLVP